MSLWSPFTSSYRPLYFQLSIFRISSSSLLFWFIHFFLLLRILLEFFFVFFCFLLLLFFFFSFFFFFFYFFFRLLILSLSGWKNVSCEIWKSRVLQEQTCAATFSLLYLQIQNRFGYLRHWFIGGLWAIRIHGTVKVNRRDSGLILVRQPNAWPDWLWA